MPTIKEMADEAFRDYVTDGVPSSGAHKPAKSAIRDVFTAIDDGLVDDLTFNGVYSSGTTYAVGALVSYDGSSYVSRVASNLNHQPDISATQWQLSAARGAAGSSSLDRFVSETDGSDGGAGTFDDPYETWEKGYDETPAGATMWLFGTPDAPQTYKDTGSSLTSIDKAITVRAINKHGAIVTSNGVTAAALGTNPAAGETINLIGVIIDPSANGSSTNLYTLFLSCPATAYYVNCTDCLFRGWTGVNNGRGVAPAATDFRGYLQFTRCTFIGDSCANALRMDVLEEGGIELNDCDLILTDQNTTGNGAVRIVATAADVYARILNCRTVVSLDLTAVVDTQRYGYNIIGVEGAKVSGGYVDILGPGSVCSAYGVMISTNGAGDATELSIDDSVIEDISIYCEPSGGGIAAGIGNDGAGDPTKMNCCIMQRVKARGSRASADTGGLHGVFFGCITDGKMRNNETNCVGFNGFKNTIDCDATGNTFIGTTEKAFNFKGAVGGTVSDNTSRARPGTAMTMFALTQDVGGTDIFTSGVTIAQNYCGNEGNSSVVFVDVDAGSSFAAFTNNAWANLVGSLHANPFQNGATNYATFGAWHAAVGTTDVANFSVTYASFPYGAIPFGGFSAGQDLTIEERIERTLFSYAATITTEADPPKVFPNTVYIPTDLYLRIEQFPNRNERIFIVGSNPHLRQGILQITVVSPLNVGPSVATKVGGQVAENFPADLEILNYGLMLRIQEAPYLGPAFPADAAWIAPVSIRYEVFA